MEAFDLEKEKCFFEPRTYGEGSFAAGCLMARRLIEAGVTFVEVSSNNWEGYISDNYQRTSDLCNESRPPLRLTSQT